MEFIAFEAGQRVAGGDIEQTLAQAKARIDAGANPADVLIFEVATGRQRDFDFRGSLTDVLVRNASTDQAAPAPEKRGRGRPKLGVVAREITLLPRHWAWLQAQGRPPSATLRRLVEQTMQSEQPKDAPNAEALWRIMTATCGNLANFEEATRALFAGDHERVTQLIADWPQDIREFLGEQLR